MKEAYYEGKLVTLYNSDCRNMSELADESVHCAVTSPPYFGLRKYEGNQVLVWGGNPECEHEWGQTIPHPASKSGPHGPNSVIGAKKPQHEARKQTSLGNFCQKCGAWKGALGLEPTPELYVEHTVEILREVRRVLRKDGVVFWNCGDSYFASGGAHKPEHANPGLSKSAQRGGVPHSNLDEIDETDAMTQCDPSDAWTAGFFDGEGNIAITKNAGRSAGKLRITAAQVDKLPIERLQYLFGGSIRMAPSKRENWRAFWVWECSAKKAVDALKRMEPFLLVKKRQAELAYQFQSTVGTNDGGKPRLTQELIAERERIKQAISDCNHSIPDEQLELKSKDLCLIPSRVALALQSDGWWVRSVIIWHKPNPMPESVNGWRWEKHRIKVKNSNQDPNKSNIQGDSRHNPELAAEWIDCPGCEKCNPNDGLVLRKGSWRPTNSYEHILMLTKSASYYCDADAVREESQLKSNSFGSNQRDTAIGHGLGSGNSGINAAKARARETGGFQYRNLRDVWTFPTTPFPGAHFAVFPEKLPKLCIKAATSEKGCCPKCGAPWARVISKHIEGELEDRPYCGKGQLRSNGTEGGQGTQHSSLGQQDKITRNTISWKPTCTCGCSETIPCTVLDPFAGASTTLLVARKLNRQSIGYELSSDYCKLGKARLKNYMPLWEGVK